MSDELKDKCGVFGIFGHKEAAYLTYLGIYALQHRGESTRGHAPRSGPPAETSPSLGRADQALVRLQGALHCRRQRGRG